MDVTDHSEVLPLAGDFAEPTLAEWETQVLKVFNRKRPPERQLTIEQCYRRLHSSTVDGIEIKPLYLAEDRELGLPGVMPFRRGATVRTGAADAWDVRQFHDDPDPVVSRQEVLTDLERGVTSIWCEVGDGAISASDLPEVLTDVLIELAPLAVSSRTDQAAAASALLTAWAAHHQESGSWRGNLGLDPLAFAAIHATTPDLRPAHEFVRRAIAELPGVRAMTVDVTAYHNAGAGDVDELAFAIATGVEYLRDLEAAGIPPQQAFGQIEFRVSATADQFLTIARLRALRQLWARIGELCGVPEADRGARQHAVTSERMLSRDDPWVNMLRGTIACFAASVGGAEAITVLPFDHVHGLPDAFARRVARNTQIVLAEESNIARVNDPAGGAWFVESLTDELAAAAWRSFQGVESAGGMISALGSGLVGERIATTTSERLRRLADRSAPLTGVSMFPMTREQPLQRTPRKRPVEAGLRLVRDAEVYERLRDRATRHQATTGEPPKVFLATIGKRRDYGARETFSSALLAAAAIEPVPLESTDPEAFAEAYRASGASVALLCSSAKMYAEHGLQVAGALRAAGAEKIYLAGSVKELGADPDGAIDGTVFAGMDVVSALGTILDESGVQA